MLRTSRGSRLCSAERTAAKPPSFYLRERLVALRRRWWLRHPRPRGFGLRVEAAARACANLALAAKTQTLQPGQQLHILGTRIYCGAKSQSTGVLTTCLIVKTGTQRPEGYSVGIDDKIAGASQFKGLSAPAVFI